MKVQEVDREGNYETALLASGVTLYRTVLGKTVEGFPKTAKMDLAEFAHWYADGQDVSGYEHLGDIPLRLEVSGALITGDDVEIVASDPEQVR